MVVVEKVTEGSIAEQVGIAAGDILLSIDEQPIRDMLDYQFLTSDFQITLLVEKPDGEQWEFAIEKDFDEDLGLGFSGFIFDQMKRCKNKCVFCFIDQLPDQMRSTLYTKDDDYRYSFWYGNFITLTNLKEDDWEKIIRMRLSPLYVSVHCMDPGIRARMLNNPAAARIQNELQRLHDADIMIHTQIVLCPGINDGEVLQDTIEKLAALYPAVQSIGIVPVGLTGHRDKLTELRVLELHEINEVIDLIEQYQQRFRKECGLGLVYLADEFYLSAGRPIPDSDYYDDYVQIENGIGLSRILLEQFVELESELPEEVTPCKVHLLTGQSGLPVLNILSRRLNKIKGLQVEILPIKNNFFGGHVSVTGLLTGSDIIHGLGKEYEGETIIIPEVLCLDGQNVLLDDISITEISRQTGAHFRIVDGSARSLVNAILKGVNHG